MDQKYSMIIFDELIFKRKKKLPMESQPNFEEVPVQIQRTFVLINEKIQHSIRLQCNLR